MPAPSATQNRPLWAVSATETIQAAALDRDLSVDLAIIGGGFTGCAAALAAARLGARVVLLEADRIGAAASGRNVGLVNAGLWLPPDTVMAQMGAAPGRRLIDALAGAPTRVFDLIADQGMACEPVRNGTLHLAHAASGWANLEDRWRQGNALGAPLQLLDAEETKRRLGSSAFHGALFDPRAGTVQPRAYCVGLARAAKQAGALLYETSPVTRLRHDGLAWEVTAQGHTVRAERVLLATNAYQTALTGPAPSYTVVHYSQFATAPLPPELRKTLLPGGEGCWDTALVMSSIRMDQAGRLIFGGMGDAMGPGAKVHQAWAKAKLASLFPELGPVTFEHIWQGRIAMTSDHIPKALAFGPNALAVFGYSGRGIAPGTVLGQAAAETLLTDRDTLPLPVIASYSEQFTGPKAAYYECGATLIHGVDLLKP